MYIRLSDMQSPESRLGTEYNLLHLSLCGRYVIVCKVLYIIFRLNGRSYPWVTKANKGDAVFMLQDLNAYFECCK